MRFSLFLASRCAMRLVLLPHSTVDDRWRKCGFHIIWNLTNIFWILNVGVCDCNEPLIRKRMTSEKRISKKDRRKSHTIKKIKLNENCNHDDIRAKQIRHETPFQVVLFEQMVFNKTRYKIWARFYCILWCSPVRVNTGWRKAGCTRAHLRQTSKKETDNNNFFRHVSHEPE